MASVLSRACAAIALLAIASAASGCYAKSTAYNGRFTFGYASGLDVENFVKPIAPGAKLDVVAFANGTEDKLTITKATSSAPGVVAITSVAETTLTLRGVAPGVSDIEITAVDSHGNTLVDKMFFHVQKPAVHKLEHACTDEADAVYVQGDQAVVFHQLATSDGRSVIGYDYAPLRIEPAAALELLPPRQGEMGYAFRTPKKASHVSVRSTVDDTAVSLQIIGRDEIKAATLSCEGCRVLERGTIWVFAHTTFGDAPVCSQNAKTIAKSLTPDICTVTAKLDDDDDDESHARARSDDEDSNRSQLAIVKGLKFGVCKYEVTLPELNGGRGLRLAGEANVGRVHFPGDGSSDEEQSTKLPTRLALGAAAWFLVGTGWVAPSIIALIALAWTKRRKRN